MIINKKKFNGKICFFDIETSYNKIAAFQIGYNLSILPQQILEERKIITISWIFEGQKKASYMHWDRINGVGDDTRMIEEFIYVLKAADVAVAQNGDRFDIKHLKTRALLLGLEPLTNIATIDTLKLNRANFAFNSNKLDYVAKVLGGKGKDKMELQDWIDIVEHNDEKKLQKMIKYNQRDVIELRDIFWKILPYCEKLPVPLAKLTKIGRESHGEVCPMCASVMLESKGYRYLVRNVYRRFVCKDCGHNFRSQKPVKVGDIK